MPYKKSKKSGGNGKGKIAVMLILIFLSIAIVGVVYLINSGIIKLPDSEQTSTGTVITLSSTELSVYVTMQETLTVSPADARVTFKSSDDSVATVDQKGVISGKKPGEVTITVTAEKGSAVTCKVTVVPLPELASSGGNFDQGKLDELNELLHKKPLSISVYYKNLSSGATITYNSERKYQTGSVIKAPYCKWLISSGADLEKELILEDASIVKGSGNIQKSPLGTAFTVKALIDECIINSDNTAYNMLAREFGFDGYLSYVKGLGVYANQSKSNIFGNMSAAGAGVLFADIYSFSQSSPDASAFFMEDLKNPSYQNLISAAVDVPVAHKYGYNNGNNGFHDAGIVYADTPYVLTIFSTLNPDTNGSVEYIQSIAKMINSIH